ncbi:MAG: LysR family transcriptional regulator [Alphaproteobacteria bacterium]|jgi:DNA-binding transcriptional LysR family regulator|nr:LysR family transcriptional regulator [Alphaproteobacteria bacterium]MBT4965805.1 LysR family transcriptional regulator [Alphaproteobacteria bacterium]MBT5158965.1 LysR family transcriptional regulator [Alphaproteobacteria bacterium]MBT6385132.1 LysR family transcriptional regulator [Alphaproteobacteria bacterium]
MEIYQIRYFLAVAETGSFTKAADRVHVSQPTLSAGIKKLEAGLQSTLFDRQARRSVLSPAGIRFLDRARTIMAEVERARTELTETSQTRLLRLGCLPGLPGRRLADLLATFSAAYSDITLDLREAEADRLEQWLEQDRIDVALTTTGPLSDARSTPLYRQNMVLGMAQDHPFTSRQTVRPEDLKDQPYVLRQHCPFVRPLNTYFTERNIRPKVLCRTRQETRALTLVAAGLGVTILPDTLNWPGVRLRPMDGLNMQSTIALVRQDGVANETADLFQTFATSHDWKPHEGDDITAARLNWAH